jgi:hypothetical protein
MSKLTRAAATSQTLSLAAMEEASRFGVRDADIEHLFLALVIDGGVGGQVLRSLGITLSAARAAVADEHADRLASLGVSADVDESRRIVFHETAGYEWTDRAVAVLAPAWNSASADSAAVLRTLLAEPSGSITALLTRLGVEPAAVESLLDTTETVPRHSTARPDGGRFLRSTHSTFVPAGTDEVRMLLSDPARIPEWDPSVGAVTASAGPTTDDQDGGVWEALSRTTAPDGKPLKVKEAYSRQRAELRTDAHRDALTWRMEYPDAPRSNTRVTTFALEPAAGGTQVAITFGWERPASRRRMPVLAALMRPLYRAVMFIQVTQISSGISRAFR